MKEMMIRDAIEEDFTSIILLNEAEVQQTSPMDLEKLRLLDGVASYHKVAIVNGHVAAFLLAIREGEAYRNDNYNWFASRFQKFLYVDRIVVGVVFSGLKIGSKLYNDMFENARTHGVKTITCEYNIKPLNIVSRAFHDKFGFKELATQWVANGTKQVSLQVAEI